MLLQSEKENIYILIFKLKIEKIRPFFKAYVEGTYCIETIMKEEA
jgi:hypothetical protein